MQHGALAFLAYDLTDAAIALNSGCFKLKVLSELERGILHENIAVIHRDNGNPKLMVREMKTATENYKKTDDDYRVCVALKNLGEAEWMLGYRATALRFFRESDLLSERLDQSKRAGVHWNLASAARRIGEKKMEIDNLMRCMKEFPEDETDKILAVDKRLSELMY